VKVSDFTGRDKSHLLDLFVNNEKTLLNVYEALFPHRATTGTGAFSQGQSGNQFGAEPPYQTGSRDGRSGGGNRSSSHFGNTTGSASGNPLGMTNSQVRQMAHA